MGQRQSGVVGQKRVTEQGNGEMSEFVGDVWTDRQTVRKDSPEGIWCFLKAPRVVGNGGKGGAIVVGCPLNGIVCR